MKKSLFGLLIVFLLGSCQYEPYTDVDYTFFNKTGVPVSLLMVNTFQNEKDTIDIGTESFYVFEYSYEDVKSPPTPFYSDGIDSIYLMANDSIYARYFNGDLGQSPYNFDSYTGGEISNKRGTYYFSYSYDIILNK